MSKDMRRLPSSVLLSSVLLLGLSVASWGQRPGPARVREREMAPWEPSFSLEVGTGLAPLHMLFQPTVDVERALAQRGQEVEKDRASFPVLSLSGVWRAGALSEMVVTAGVSCCYYNILQYPVFGTDPNGNPRYDLNFPSYAGRGRTDLCPTLTVRYRHLWNPWHTVVFYNELGVGIGDFSDIGDIRLLPAMTPFGVRCGGQHFYFYFENTFSPVATLVHCGLGWRF